MYNSRSNCTQSFFLPFSSSESVVHRQEEEGEGVSSRQDVSRAVVFIIKQMFVAKMSFELVAAPGVERRVTEPRVEDVSHDVYDDGKDCDHDTFLTFRNILRVSDAEGVETCYDGRRVEKERWPSNYRPYSPPKPKSYPLDQLKLELWKKKAIENETNPFRKRIIETFAKKIRHISFKTFLDSLRHCFDALYRFFPTDVYYMSLQNKTMGHSGHSSNNSEFWMAEIVNRPGMYRIPDLLTAVNKKEIKLVVEDAIYTASNFYQRMGQYRGGVVYAAPYIRNLERVLAESAHNLRGFYSFCDSLFFNVSKNELFTVSIEDTDDESSEPENGLIIHRRMIKQRDFSKNFQSKGLVIFYEEMDGAFYFDHKMADGTSWPGVSRYMRGLYGRFRDLKREVFVKGCENEPFDISKQAHNSNTYTCPVPPYATSEFFSRKNSQKM